MRIMVCEEEACEALPIQGRPFGTQGAKTMSGSGDWSDRKKWTMGILSSLLVAAILGAASYMRSESDDDALDADRHPDRFVGSWVNENPETDGFTRVRIVSRLNGFYIWLWGRCHPVDCISGPFLTPFSDADDATLTFDSQKRGIESTYDLAALADGRIRLSYRTQFTDGRPELENIQYFLRGEPSP